MWQRKATRRRAGAYAAFCVAFFALLFTNKSIATRFGDHAWILVGCMIWQCCCSALLIRMMSSLGIGPAIKPLTKRKFNKLLFSPLLYTLMVFSSLQCLYTMSIASFMAAKSLSIGLIALGESLLFGVRLSRELWILLLFMLSSAA